MKVQSNPDKTPVAQDLFTYCTKEKTNTWHVVMHHGSHGFVEKVKCKACGSEHRYKRQIEAMKPARASSAILVRKNGVLQANATLASKPSSSQGLEDTWFQGLKKWGEKPITLYDLSQCYEISEVFSHPVFGKGVVQARRENKIDVLFQSGIKTLPSPIKK